MVPTARILADRRLLVLTLGVLGLANLIGLGLVIGPMRARVQGLTQRASVAALASATAARDLAAARATSKGSAVAVKDLARFHDEILPVSQPAARQITFVRLAQLAREHNLTYERRAFAQDALERESTLTRATLTMSVLGSYRDLRQFLYALETGEDFVVIRELRVAQADDPGEPLEAALTLSTYYKAGDGR